MIHEPAYIHQWKLRQKELHIARETTLKFPMDHVTTTSTIMARLRWKLKRMVLVIAVACLLWLMYLLTLLPSKGHLKSETADLPQYKSISRQYSTSDPAVYKPHIVEPKNNVLDAPQGPALNKESESRLDQQKDVANIAPKEQYNDKHDGPVAEKVEQDSIPLKNSISELGVKSKNKTYEGDEKMKNKTLEQLGVMGVVGGKKRELPQLVIPMKWNLSVSFDDIGAIMKETEFLNKVDPLNLHAPILLSSRNRTANFTYSMPLKFGFCDCFEHYCLCCGRLTNAKLHLNTTACTNFTFMSKTHELDLSVSLSATPIYHGVISADKPPLLCIGSSPQVADMCLHFFNMTYKVNEHNAHQTQLLGCFDFSLNLFNRTIGAFPVDCFQIPGDPNVVHKERVFNMVFNWMP